jgi:hypothetical protein
MTGAHPRACRFSGRNETTMYPLIAILLVLGTGLAIPLLRINGRRPSAWLRILAVYALAAAVVTPMVADAAADPEFKVILKEALAGMSGGAELSDADSAAFMEMMVALSVRSYPLGITLFVLFCWYVMARFRRRQPVQWRASAALAKFRIAEYVVWPLLASLATFGAGRVVQYPPAIDIAVTVTMLGLVLLYFFQGLGIVCARLERSEIPGMRRMGLPLVLAILFLVPVLNFVLVVGLPLLGVLELWIRMRPATHDEEGAPPHLG